MSLITPAPAPAEAAKQVVHLQVLTNSRMAAAKSCLRKAYYRYELGLQRNTQKAPLRFGSAFHKGRELIRKGVAVEAAIQEATGEYAGATGDDAYDQWTITALLTGWAWHWQEPVENQAVCTERAWEMPLINPESGMPSRTWKLSGKIDGIDNLPDGRIAVSECKTCGEDIGPDSAYWLRLRADQQIGLYVLAARSMGFDVSCVVYDVIRKPSIRPKQIPTLDSEGLKVVIIDATGERALNKNGTPRQSAGEGMTLVSRTETPEEFANRLLEDIQARPEFYYQRREIPVIQDELEELRWELWQQAQSLRAAQIGNRWFKSVGRMTCDYCEYAQICLQHQVVDPANPPSGFEIVTDVNPELAE
jgi:hypothetical protein